MTPTLAQWRARGSHREVAGHPLFVIDEGAREAPVIAVLHGFPSASYDWYRVLPALAAGHRVVIHDQLGFGLSAKPRDAGYSILDQADRALALWQQLGLARVHLLAHDYGCSVATELFHRRAAGTLPLQLASATLVNSGLYYDMARLRLVQHLLRLRLTRPLASRLGSGAMYRLNMRRLWAAPTPELDAELDVLWQMTCLDHGKAALGWLSHYLEERRWIHKARWADAIRRFDAPAHVLWGDRDPVGVPAIAQRLASELPRATLTWLPGVGHYPMLEAGERFSAAALGFIGRVP